jgi:hypothetical protein
MATCAQHQRRQQHSCRNVNDTCLWLTNFALLYTLKPKIAAQMPAYWTPIPETVADAILNSQTGLVQYSDFQSAFPSSP